MITYEIIGDDMQAVVVSLGSGDAIRAEAGARTYMTDGIEMDARMQGGLGEGFILERLEGTGDVFGGCLVAFDPTVDYDIELVGGIKTAIFGGEGLFVASRTGPGRVWVQTRPFSRLAERIHAAYKGDREEDKPDLLELSRPSSRCSSKRETPGSSSSWPSVTAAAPSLRRATAGSALSAAPTRG